MIPSGIATRIATAIAASASWMVRTSREPISRVTGVPYRNELPRSPRTIPPRKARYCTSSGRSRPSDWRSFATSSGGALSPSMACAGSPGTRWISENTSVATPSSTGIVSSKRRNR